MNGNIRTERNGKAVMDLRSANAFGSSAIRPILDGCKTVLWLRSFRYGCMHGPETVIGAA